ncbi:hypothetical protein BDZ91DRAFT_763717 [Kalaharituber pfeilii]|nr:hypothetical protein BDZ91DRAFT_763717 [Kalaharituber pfeilii]
MAQRQTGRENLVNAVIEFSAILSAKERNTLTQTNTITDILDLTKALQDARVSRNKIKQCAAFLQSVQQFSSVVDTMIQFTPAISTMVWGSSTILLLEFQDLWPHYLGLQDAVFEYYAQVKSLLIAWSGNSKILKSFLPPVKDELQDVEKKLIFQQKIVEYQIILAKEDTARKARQQQILFNVNWEAHKDVELQEWAKTRDFELKQKFQKKRAKLTKYGLNGAVDARQQLLKQISDYNHTTMFLEFMKGSHPRTGEWLYEMGEFKEWVQSHHSSLLWCHGISGSGKSVLSTSVVKHLMDTCLQQTTYEPGKTFIGYFFCTFSDYHSLVFEVIIRSLIKQILSVFHGSAEFEEYLAKFFNQCNNIPSVHQWQKLFIRTCSLPNHIYLILDGVDECHDDIQAQILELLNEMLSIPRSIKIYLSSRKEVYLARNLTHAISISLDDVKWRPEIEGYIDESLRQRLNDGRLQIEDPTMVEEIKQALMVGAEGMQLNDEEIREALRSLPRDLDEIYIRMLQRIIKEYKKDIAVEAFRWLTRARRQLSLRELVEAVVIRDEDTVRAQGLNRIPTDLGKVIEACGDFLVIEEPVCDSSTVRFIHSSVVTFLHKYKLPVQLEVFRMEPQTTEAHLAKRCLQYLHFQDLQTKNANLKVFSRTSAMGADTDAATSQMHKSTLYDYVIKNWLSHCQKLPTTSGSSMDEKQYWTWFRNLVFNGFNSIKFPWPSDSPSTVDYPHHELFKWAVQNSHQALIQLIFQEVASVGITPPQKQEKTKQPSWLLHEVDI